MGWNYLSIPKLQRLHRWSLGMDKLFHPTHYKGCNYLSMLGLKWTVMTCKCVLWLEHEIRQAKTNLTRTTRMAVFWGYPLLPHDYSYYRVILDPKSKEDKVKVTNLKNLPKFQISTWHTLWSCLIRCANMKWIWWVLLKIQSRHDSVHRRTDRHLYFIFDLSIRWS